MQLSEKIWSNENLVKTLKDGGVVVMPTDTIYGIVGLAQNEPTVNRIYKIRKRNPQKPCVILIGDISELEKFSIILSEEQKNKLKEYWFTPSEGGVRPTSIILDCSDDRFLYLHRGARSLAFRLPLLQGLRNLLIKTGPLIAPSANLEALPLSKTIFEAKEYFGNSVDLYIDGGKLVGQASKVIELYQDGSASILRE
ncbi:hypothetical protein A2814_02550 [Candidatus Nomurabacteria bacterium RIFCSPHIGHO2_01_FULL_38_19]|uniref:L-threonylcarbamoyladenylate synthase n=1 Tax=Candidatus Nomurabacteria bacterium RIFCSPHIGHO2_01_FULL_38_19 TaxID=1801732 RepID=A0A1F6URB3_9BACT|nr:MAG: hypothetical protein A2814_02550 [Candidatus Nomurabacteria bacterium RIFCSPHIGHO2_01_FULL_38_19]